ncbi:hypothetical protein MLD38_005615 [Melastoma candidum]|uniref:Uncharacterized protein n=1 Tax=Melastoma candidum TaxID=119954 RepID=A0ACB9RTM4_9MYRT|nr:hypothetical protein MLD38_005615 [Melastoma candidum]
MTSFALTPNVCSFSQALNQFQSPLTLLPLNRLSPYLPQSPALTIRMGGGPRTYPGGVTKWQWKRMQAKKAKQLLKARLARERHIYEMRKRAELRAAVSELERPWEPVMAPERAPKLFSVSADDQLKALADRFQKPGGFDLWTDRDGPQLFRDEEEDWSGSARFFPKGVVHSVKPYRSFIRDSNENTGDDATDIGFQNSRAEEEGNNRMKGNDLWRRTGNENGEVVINRQQRGRQNAKRRDYRKDRNV